MMAQMEVVLARLMWFLGLVQMKLDDKSLSPAKASDLVQKFSKDGEDACAFVIGERVMAVHFESFYWKQDTEWEHSFDFEVKKAIDTDRNQRSIGLFGPEKIVQFWR